MEWLCPACVSFGKMALAQSRGAVAKWQVDLMLGSIWCCPGSYGCMDSKDGKTVKQLTFPVFYLTGLDN